MDNIRITVVDYGMGNLRSISNKFGDMGIKVLVSSDPEDIKKASKLILPGVGHFASGIRNLRDSGLLDILQEKVIVDKIPILGICLGMQLFTDFSEEGGVQGLGWVKARTIRFNFDTKAKGLKIPHMGWNSIAKKKASDLLNGIDGDVLFYFEHSYYIVCDNHEDILSTTDYGCGFVSSIQKGNIYGTQFHPEKSHKGGLQLLKNFVKIN